MDNLYFKVFEKYGPALSANLWPNQMQILQQALQVFAETGRVLRLEDSFTRLAYMMVICDLMHTQKQETAKKAEEKHPQP